MHYDLEQLDGATLYDPQGDKIGKIDDVFYDTETGKPEWLLVDTGFFSRDTMVPVTDLRQTEDGYQVPFSRDQVKNAPSEGIDKDDLSENDEQKLYSYYGIPSGKDRSRTILPEGQSGGQMQGQMQTGRGTGEDAMTRSEEELDIHKVRRPSELVRLKKRIVTENVQQTVPVQHEEVVVEREPITDQNRDKAMQGPELTENEYEVATTREEVVTDKHVEPKERIRLDKQESTEQETVNEELRKEQVDVEHERGREDQAA